jgi:hypothetical protein
MKKALRREASFGVINRFYVMEKAGCNIAIPALIPTKLIEAIDMIGLEQHRVRVYYGDVTTGRVEWDNFFKHDNGRPDLRCGSDLREGRVSISQDTIRLRIVDSGPYHDIDANYLLLMHRKDSKRGEFIRWENIVKIEYSNKRDGGTIWQHPLFHNDGDCDDQKICENAELVSSL